MGHNDDRLSGRGTWTWIVLMWFVPLQGYRTMVAFPRPCPWLKMEISLPLSNILFLLGVCETVLGTKVKGHATEADVELGRMRAEDRLGDAEAGIAADLGRRHMLQLHRFMIAISQISVIMLSAGVLLLIPWFGMTGQSSQMGQCAGTSLGFISCTRRCAWTDARV